MAETKQKKSWKELFDKHAESKGKTKIGDYQEAAGGGTPMTKGQKVDYVADTVEEAHQYRKDHPGAIVRVNQPRDEDGQFTYNSANERELEYGPSRGKTIPPFLKDMEISFAKKSGQGSIIMDGKRYKPLVAFKSAAELVQMFKEYSKKEDSFVGGLGEGFGAMSESAKGMGGKVAKTSMVKEAFVPTVKETTKKYKAAGWKPENVAFVKEKKAPAAAPTEKKQETSVEEKKTPATTNPFEMVKTDIEGFKAKNSAQIQDFYNFAEQYGYDESDFDNEFWESALDSGAASFEELKKLFLEDE